MNEWMLSFVMTVRFWLQHDLEEEASARVAHPVDPGGDRVLRVVGRLQRGVAGRVPMSAGRHLLSAHRLHRVRRHQAVNHGQVSALRRVKNNTELK